MIIAAEYCFDYKIRVIYDSGDNTVIDFEHFLNTNKNPMNRQFLNKELFKKFTVENGIITWTGPEGDMDFDNEHITYINQPG